MASDQTRSNPRLDARSPGAIVLGGNFVGLGLARSLGRHGIPTWVFDSDRSKSIAHFSRYTTRFIASKEDPHDWLLREGRQHRLNGWVVFPVNDEYVEILAVNHRSLSSIYHLATPPFDITRFALDKRLTYHRARELGIATPWTVVGDAPAEVIAKDLRYPAILKPAISHHFFPQTNLKVLPASTPSEFHQNYAQMSKYIPADELLVQERIPGGGENQFSLCAVCKSGQTYATLVAQRRRQYPVDFGNASSFVETTRLPVVEADGRRFLESIGFDGMAEVEFKLDPRDGRYKILDVNARPWGWHTLTRAAGADFAYLLWRQKVGLPAGPVPTPCRAAWLREITDLFAIAKSSQRAAELKALWGAIRKGRLEFATFDLLDPVPFFAEFGLWFSDGLSRRKRAREVLAVRRD